MPLLRESREPDVTIMRSFAGEEVQENALRNRRGIHHRTRMEIVILRVRGNRPGALEDAYQFIGDAEL